MNIKFIIVEGNDGTGKTTLVDELSGVLRPQGWDTKTLVHRLGDQFSRYLLEYSNADRIIFNRSHFAEQVFGSIYRGTNPFSDTELETLNAIVRQYAMVIYCDLPILEIKKRLDRRNQLEVLSTDDTTLEQLEVSANVFQKVFAHENVVRYEPHTQLDLQGVLEMVVQKILKP
jgi:thymidylate kinase